MCSLVASTPAVCFSAVVSSANRNTVLITCLKCQDIENHVVICFKNGSVLTLTDQLIAIPLRQDTFTTLFELRELKCSQVVNIHAMVFFISFELFSSKIFLFLASIFLYFQCHQHVASTRMYYIVEGLLPMENYTIEVSYSFVTILIMNKTELQI